MSESQVSLRSRAAAEIIRSFTSMALIGKGIKTGKLRRHMVEPPWKVPGDYFFNDVNMGSFHMKYLSPVENPSPSAAVLQLHGGGYMAPVRNAYYSTALIYSGLCGGAPVLTPDYRIAPGHPYPAALDDAEAAFIWLTERGFSPGRIILAGDSAGGGLAMALTMRLRDKGMELPAGIVAMSPWTDLTASGKSYEENFEADPLFGNTRESMIYENSYPGDEDPHNPYISPRFGTFRGFPPMLIQVGSMEMLLSDSVDAAKLAQSACCDVRLSVYEGMFHDFQLAGTALPEAADAWKEVGEFLKEIMDKA